MGGSFGIRIVMQIELRVCLRQTSHRQWYTLHFPCALCKIATLTDTYEEMRAKTLRILFAKYVTFLIIDLIFFGSFPVTLNYIFPVQDS